MRRILAASAVVGLATLVFGTATLASVNSDADGRRGGRRVQVIRLVERAQAVALDDRVPPGPSLADRLVFTADMFDMQGRRIGRDGADCVVVRIDPAMPPAEQQIVECMVSVELPGGQLTFQGLAQGPDNTFALTGGTGAFRTASGEAVVHDRVPLQEAEVTITLLR